MNEILLKYGILVSDEYDSVPLDILIGNGHIIKIASDIAAGSASVIDVRGKFVSPGFVNMHAHDDFYLCEPDAGEIMKSIYYQGVTTSVTGNCGFSNFPISESHAQELESYQGFIRYRKGAYSWRNFPEYIEQFTGKLSLNVIPLIGHGTIRVGGSGFAKTLTSSQKRSMIAQLSDFIAAGGCGLSSGLMYMPGTFADTDEIVSLINSVEKCDDFVYTSHLRGYSDTFMDSIREAIEIGKRTGVKVICSHLGPFGPQYGRELVAAIEMLEDASRAGVEISYDTLAYCGGSTTIMALVPPWLYSKGVHAFIDQLKDDTYFAELITTLETYVPKWPSWEGNGWTDNFVHCLGWDNLIVLSARNKLSVGKNFATIGKELGISLYEAFRKVLIEEQGEAMMLMAGVGTCIDEKTGEMRWFDAMVENPLSLIGIDAIFVEDGRTMPYAFGTFPKIVNRYVKLKKTLTLQDVIRKFTVNPLRKFGIVDRGVLREGAAADIVVFDLDEMRDYPDFFSDHPRMASGVEHLFINGEPVIVDKAYQPESLSGKFLLHGGSDNRRNI